MAEIATAPTLRQIPLSEIHEHPDNPRKYFDPVEVDRMTVSMQKVGQLTPVNCRARANGGGYELAAGATRLRAATRAKWPSLLAVVHPYTDDEFFEVLAYENLERKMLRPLEEARAYQLLMQRIDGYTVERIAERRKKSVDYVRDRLRLFRLDAAAAKLLDDETIELGHALELAKLSHAHQAKAIKDGLFTAIEEHRSSALLKLTDTPKQKPVTVYELKAWIEKHLLADVTHPDLAELFPETQQVLERGKAQKLEVVYIATGYLRPEVKGRTEVLTPANWRRADGEQKSKTCDRKKKVGIVAGGDAARTHGFLICTSKACAVHFPEHVKRAAQKAKGAAKAVAKGKAPLSFAEQEKRRRDAEEKERAARKARCAQLVAVLPAVTEQVLTIVSSLSAERILSALEQSAPMAKGTARGKLLLRVPTKDLAGRLRRLYLADLLSAHNSALDPRNEYWFERSLTALCKELGIKLDKLLAAAPTEQPAAPKVAPAAPAAAKAAAPKKKAVKRKADKAFMAPVQPDAVLGAIVGTTPLTRTDLTKRLWAHIKKHGLQDKKHRRMINAGTTLLALFDGKKQVSMFDLTKLVTKHCTKASRA